MTPRSESLLKHLSQEAFGSVRKMILDCFKFQRRILRRTFETDDRLCGPVVRVPGYRSGGAVSIPGSTKFSEKK
jgi:hypothetical protein